MTRGLSYHLDLLRFGAAFIVLISHFAYPRFSEGRYLWVRELNLGSDAVVLFFVLSGLVIAYSAQHKDADIGQFAFNRMTRIFSVALPALVLGFALDRAGAGMFGAFYEGRYYNPLPFTEQMLRGLSFSNEWTGQATRLGSNGPYWSLSYEVGYYILFAVAWYMRGLRRAAVLIGLTLLIGVNVMLLMPSWLLGVWVWQRIDKGALPGVRAAPMLFVLPIVFYAMALAMGLPDMLKFATWDFLGSQGYQALRFSDEFIWNTLLGVGMATHLLGAATLLKRSPALRIHRAVKWLAAGSFSLYLMHYPLLQILRPTLPQTGVALLDDLVLLGVTLLGCFAFAALFERSLKSQRAVIQTLFSKKAPSF